MANKFKTREIAPDPMYDNLTVAKFVNMLMEQGKKNIARKIVYGSFDIIKEKTKKNPLDVFQEAIENIAPLIEVRSRRIGGANYQIPFPTNENRRFVLASRWIIEAAKARKGKSMAEKIAQEFLDAMEKQGTAIRKRDDVHRMAEANKAFAHFARY